MLSLPSKDDFLLRLKTFSLSCAGLGAATSGGAKQVAPALQQQNNRRKAGRWKPPLLHTAAVDHSKFGSEVAFVDMCLGTKYIPFHWYLSKYIDKYF